ncbi:4'-phosphopantetheinyl transferase family protein [Spongiivirga citrea]|uniref:4'-phosphopantetheinyl transferase superfamily protein n=1 Tax=Spongiivirga citrea TaxID=1481457 RepID=A0A6M0CI62_9FLAO|nr:4'-phosphopantetheinyl transferase superfamily protein [Spongiivirga citrea]NER15619.1 4'-phosphopantetheinyl transferase superfamily protein [Spongiivirga citrea]
MIGNDVVDFQQAQLDGSYNRPRFMDKTFNLHEKEYILANEYPHKMACIYWSVKEAAYKAYVRETRNRFLNPKRIHLQLKDGVKEPIDLLVSIDSFSYMVEIEVNECRVVSVAKSMNQFSKKLFSHTIQLPSNQYSIQNVYTKTAVLDFISKHLNKPKHCLSIGKNELGIPFLFMDGSKKEHQISLTHHGEYAAYAVAF